MHLGYAIAIGAVLLAILFLVIRVFHHQMFSIGGKSICPRCGALYIKPTTQRGWADRIYHACGLDPYRCTVCELRFHRPPF